jgi:hypothetical protein
LSTIVEGVGTFFNDHITDSFLSVGTIEVRPFLNLELE